MAFSRCARDGVLAGLVLLMVQLAFAQSSVATAAGGKKSQMELVGEIPSCAVSEPYM